MERAMKLSGVAFPVLAVVLVSALHVFAAGLSGAGKLLYSAAEGATASGARTLSEERDEQDRTASPYFFVKSDDPSLDQLPLKSTSTRIDVVGVIADVKVTQVYRNEGRRAIEAVYVFPASTRAAVHGMKMTVGERVITAKIRLREEARRDYELAKQEGKSASLLEQQRPNVFEMNVANILPGDEIKVELEYTELLAPEEGVYEFVYPTVVGPRYTNRPAEDRAPWENWSRNPYLHENAPPGSTMRLSARLSAGLPIREIACTSHKVNVHYENPSRATVELAPEDTFGGNRDFILRYRLAGDGIESGLLLHDGGEENHFLLVVQPPGRVAESRIPPREYVFIVDVSGSMYGFPLDISKQLMKDLIGSLRPTDTFNVLLFAGSSELMARESVPATGENVRRAVEFIDRQSGGGGTELLPALKRALSLPKSEGVARTLVIATDGYVTVETEAFDLIRRGLGHSNFFTFGIGSSVNRYLLEGMARLGAGEPFVITKPQEAAAQADRFRRYIQAPLLTQISVDFSGFDAYDLEPASVPDVFAERPVVICGKWRGRASGSITLRGLTGDGVYSKTISVGEASHDRAKPALKYLWARTRITRLADYNNIQDDSGRTAEIADLGLRYNLLTAYTSFVAIDTQVRRKDGETTMVTQPLPLPQGVSDLAVGEVSSAALQAAPKLRTARPESTPKGLGASSFLNKQAAPATPSETKDKRGEEVDLPVPAERRVWVDKVAVPEGVSATAVRDVLEGRVDEICSCLQDGWKDGGRVTVEVHWIVDSTGRIKAVRLQSGFADVTGAGTHGVDTPGREAIELCLLERSMGLQFPTAQGAAETVIKVSLSFEPKRAM